MGKIRKINILMGFLAAFGVSFTYSLAQAAETQKQEIEVAKDPTLNPPQLSRPSPVVSPAPNIQQQAAPTPPINQPGNIGEVQQPVVPAPGPGR